MEILSAAPPPAPRRRLREPAARFFPRPPVPPVPRTPHGPRSAAQPRSGRHLCRTNAKRTPKLRQERHDPGKHSPKHFQIMPPRRGWRIDWWSFLQRCRAYGAAARPTSRPSGASRPLLPPPSAAARLANSPSPALARRAARAWRGNHFNNSAANAAVICCQACTITRPSSGCSRPILW